MTPSTSDVLRNWRRALAAGARRVWRQFFQAELTESRCTSILRDKRVTLPREFLSAASDLELRFTVRAGLLARRRGPNLEVALQPGPAAQTADVQQTRSGRRTRVRVRTTAAAAVMAGTLRVLVSEPGRRQQLGELEFRLLDDAAAQRLRLQQVKVEQVRLRVLSGDQIHSSHLVALSSDAVSLELRLGAGEFGAFLPPREAELELELLPSRARLPVEQLALRLGEQPILVSSPPLPLADRRLFPCPGPYALAARLAGREVARFEFRVLSEAEVQAQARVTRVHIAAERRNGKTMRGLKVLRWEEHRAILPWLQLESGIIAPNSSVRCVVRTLQGKTVLATQALVLTLQRHSRLVRVRRMELARLGVAGPTKPLRLSFNVEVAGELSATLSVVLLPPERLTNFEGQLTLDARHLPLDETEYDQILRGLGLIEPPLPRRRFWQRLHRNRHCAD